MKTTLWYESHNAHERLAAKAVLAKYPSVRLVDVSTWSVMRDRNSESGWPDRPVRAFPCLVLDTDDGDVELERVEETVRLEDIEEADALARTHLRDLEAALQEARGRSDVPGGARPILISELQGVREAAAAGGPSELNLAAESASSRKKPASPRRKKL